jgi:hypothetical protein
MGVFFSYERVRVSHGGALGMRRATSLIETLVVLFIISLMLGLLFPALQAARGRALAFQCQNNMNQLTIALSQSISTLRQFPQPNRWTVDLLRWMEEQPLADAMSKGMPKGAIFPRPKPMQCPSQSDESSTIANVGMCHYQLVVDRPLRYNSEGRIPWIIIDRPEIVKDDSHDPWYIGPEISFAQEREMFATRQGPHQGGLYYDAAGETHADK